LDTVCHNILLQKLKNYGTCLRLPNLLLKSYLSGRIQYINHLSIQTKCLNGVPQVSNLDPILFLIINDLPKAVNRNGRLFADDTCLIENANDPCRIESSINNNLA